MSTQSAFTSLCAALTDIRDGLRRHHLWRAFAMEDILDTYRHTSVGAVWAVFSFLSFAVAIILVFGMRGGSPSPEFVVHIVTGLLVWNYLSTIIGQSPSLFFASERYIKGSNLPLSIWAFQATLRTLILNGYAAIAALIILLYYGYPEGISFLSVFPAIIILILAAIPTQLILASLGAYTRDVQQIIENLMRAVFFVTPIIWMPNEGAHLAMIAAWNPLTPFIEIVREPLIHDRIELTSWLGASAITAGLWLFALPTLAFVRRRVVFWL